MGIDISELQRMERLSVQQFPNVEQGGFAHFVISMAVAADGFPAWGTNPMQRDQRLRQFVPTEPWLASTVGSLAARNAAFSWTLEGPPRTVARFQEALHLSHFGKGWVSLMQRVSMDLYTQDNGAFIEVIRDGDGPGGVFMGLAHLDSGRCTRTGDPKIPVIYTDIDGGQHKLAWHQVVDLTDLPSSVETMNGMQMCAVSRVLRVSQILRDVAVRKHEKLTGRFAGALHLVSGIRMEMIRDAMNQQNEEANNAGRTRFQPPLIVGTLDPHAQVKVETLELASLPEGWNEEDVMKWYIAVLALAFGCEYQDLAPLPGGGLGSGQQSEVLHLKAKGRGPELFQKIVEHALNFRVLPANVTFNFTEKDFATEQLEATVAKLRAEARTSDVTSGVLTVQVARQRMEDDGELKHEYLETMGQEDITGQERTTDEARPQEADVQVVPQPAAPAGPVGAPAGLTQKQLDDADQYYGQERGRLEQEYEEEMATALEAVRRKVEARLRAEVAGG